MKILATHLTTLGKIDMAHSRLHDAIAYVRAIGEDERSELWPRRNSDSCDPIKDLEDARAHLLDARRRLTAASGGPWGAEPADVPPGLTSADMRDLEGR